MSIDKSEEYLYYHIVEKSINNNMNWIELFLSDSSPEGYLHNILNEKYTGYGSEFIRTDWDRKSNKTIMYIADEYQYLFKEYDFYTMPFENFKQMISDWVKLKQNKAENIYFIEKENKLIFVSEKLDI
jgi:hypothetical protein